MYNSFRNFEMNSNFLSQSTENVAVGPILVLAFFFVISTTRVLPKRMDQLGLIGVLGSGRYKLVRVSIPTYCLSNKSVLSRVHLRGGEHDNKPRYIRQQQQEKISFFLSLFDDDNYRVGTE